MDKQVQKRILFGVLATVFVAAVFVVVFKHLKQRPQTSGELAFSQIGTLEEAGKMANSKSADWWLNSGGVMEIDNGLAQTNIGPLPENSSWRKLYAKTNARDTDKGFYPQNIFRLVTRGKWQNLDQQFYFTIDTLNMSESEFRSESNGVLLFNRYYDGDNLYYTGLRVDGDAVIKKKINGTYYTLAEKNIFSDGKKYDRTDNPNVLPLHQWMGIRSVVTNAAGGVDVKLYADLEDTGAWQLLLEAKDTGNVHKTAPLADFGHAGIRTDFMDVHFKDYQIKGTD